MEQPGDNPASTPLRPRRSRRRLWLLALLLVVAVIGGLGYRMMPPPLDPDEVAVAVVYHGGEDEPFLRGLRLAQERINRTGGIAGKQLRLEHLTEVDAAVDLRLDDLVTRSLRLASRIGLDRRVFAVVGHSSSMTAIPSSAIYNMERKLFLASHATASSLTNHGFEYVFAMQPNNYVNASIMARYALDQGMQRFVILADKSDYGAEASKSFAKFVTGAGGEILYQGLLAPSHRSIDRTLSFLLNNSLFNHQDIDGIFLISLSDDDTINFIRRARELGVEVPILGAENLYSSLIERGVGSKAMRDVIAVSLYDNNDRAPMAQAFSQVYSQRFGEQPDLPAAIGYDALLLLDFAVDQTGSFDASVIADQLRIMRYERPFEGATGRMTFDTNGTLSDVEIFVVRHNGQQYRTVARYRQPKSSDNVEKLTIQ